MSLIIFKVFFKHYYIKHVDSGIRYFPFPSEHPQVSSAMFLRKLWNFVGNIKYNWDVLLSSLWPHEVTLKGGVLGKGVKFFGRPIISKHAESKISLGDNVYLYSSLRSNVLGCFQPCVLRTMFPQAEIIIDSNVGMSATVLCAAASIHISEGVVIGAGSMIVDTDFHYPIGNFRWDVATPQMAKPVRIGRGVFIGARAIILKGVTIGDGAIIGAGAVVSKNVPAHHLAVGNPAQVRPLNQTTDVK